MPRKPQTEERAKGLIGREKGKKVPGAPQSVGNYKGRTLNLTSKQIAKSGVKGARKAAAAKATSISDTKFEKGKGVTKGGKAFTGNVDLGGGNIAVYVAGKRVRARAGQRVTGGGGRATATRAGSTSSSSADALRRARNQDRRTGASGAPRVGNRSAKSGTVSSAISAGYKAGPGIGAKSVWDQMSVAQKVAFAAALAVPITRIPAMIASGYITGNAIGTWLKNRR